ncbi:hypothetical protein AVEN_17980-1 [Araneus ventricosus]|uniref:Uncharacterized protein n=1 Tax=Araneus ventricosus TaxID=182803 RepID=A0A4Y2WL46_ARAVE|nr:hypothetical protein AVEN_17980-1 [Araneus ventricosus]
MFIDKDPPTRFIINRIKVKFETNETVKDAHRQRSGKPRTSTSFSQERLLESYRETSKKSVRQTSPKIGISKSSVHCILTPRGRHIPLVAHTRMVHLATCTTGGLYQL